MMNDPTQIAKSVLLDVAQVLGAFRDKVIVVGGWVPDILYPNKGHIGSLDVDFAVSEEATAADQYTTIRQRLNDGGYKHTFPPTRFVKTISSNEIKVDLLAGKSSTHADRKAIIVDGLSLNVLNGIDLAFKSYRQYELTGIMPDGSKNVVKLSVVTPEAFILIKAFALDERKKPKDAYDIYFVLKNHRPNVQTLATKVKELLPYESANEGLRILKNKFQSIDSFGPIQAAAVVEEQGEDPEITQREAFEYAKTLFAAIDN